MNSTSVPGRRASRTLPMRGGRATRQGRRPSPCRGSTTIRAIFRISQNIPWTMPRRTGGIIRGTPTHGGCRGSLTSLPLLRGSARPWAIPSTSPRGSNPRNIDGYSCATAFRRHGTLRNTPVPCRTGLSLSFSRNWNCSLTPSLKSTTARRPLASPLHTISSPPPAA